MTAFASDEGQLNLATDGRTLSQLRKVGLFVLLGLAILAWYGGDLLWPTSNYPPLESGSFAPVQVLEQNIVFRRAEFTTYPPNTTKVIALADLDGLDVHFPYFNYLRMLHRTYDEPFQVFVKQTLPEGKYYAAITSSVDTLTMSLERRTDGTFATGAFLAADGSGTERAHGRTYRGLPVLYCSGTDDTDAKVQRVTRP
jgi:hypothetical protein